MKLWPGHPYGGGGPSGPLRGIKWGCISNIVEPRLSVFRPKRANGAAVLIAPGGGYTQISIAGEGYPTAKWLNEHGVTAFVLTYRLPGEGWASGPLASFQDAQRALRMIRAHAERLDLDSQRIGVMGFSAGGHLLGLAAARPDFRSYLQVDAVDDHPARADFAALIYPVITLRPPFDRTSTKRQLIGMKPEPSAADPWSIESHIGRDAPPMFLVHAEDDPIILWQNSLLLEEACQRADVPVRFHRLARGGHGFGLGLPGTEAASWPDLAKAWLGEFDITRDAPDRFSAL